ncbi:MAG: PQQ-binding-like beta-propeller repeat protein [Planctomycetaceae bacterium]|nr:PQQ-binding-like beta-propeller repeat protein [Planctomycetaceae bacterium]
MVNPAFRLANTVLILLISTTLALADGPANWPQFRGPTGQGHADGAELPVHWSEEENVVWKTPLEGAGHSSPVIWGDQIWLTTASTDGKKLGAYSLNRDTGEITHRVIVFEPDEVQELHQDNTYASPTPAIEAGRLYVHYGRYGTACLDTETGEVLWRDTAHVIEHQGGPGSSPLLFEDLLIFNCDGADDQYVVALDTQTGQERWRTNRSAPFRENPITKRAFASCLLVEHDGQPQFISPGADQIHAYDPRTGDELWHVTYTGFSTVPAPVAANGLAYFCTGFFDTEIIAVDLDGQGNVTDSHVRWSHDKATPQTPSPLMVGGRVFIVSDKGVCTALDAQSGEQVWLKRLGGNYSASPLTDGQHIYFCCESGATKVISLDERPEIVATNKLSGQIKASPAVSGNSLYIRTDSALYRIEASPEVVR